MVLFRSARFLLYYIIEKAMASWASKKMLTSA
jgi:hypothetical protein